MKTGLALLYDDKQRALAYNNLLREVRGIVFRQYVLGLRRVEDLKWLKSAPKGWDKTIDDAIRGEHLQRTVDALIAQVKGSA